MHFSRRTLHYLSLSVTCALGDFLGGNYPPPTDLTSENSFVAKAWKNLASAYDGYLDESQTSASFPLSGAENVTFSVGLFSIYDAAAAKLQYHHTAPAIANAVNGTNKVDGDAIYKMASVSKLFTVFAGMLELTNKAWDRPLTDFIPELAEFALDNNGKENSVYTVQWNKVTPRTLASHLSGITQIGWPVSDILFTYQVEIAVDKQAATNPVTTYGFPPLDLSVLGPCSKLSLELCAVDELIKSIRTQPPTFLPWTSPVYSNLGFMLLGLAISNITGKSMDDIYRETIFKPLGMTSSFSTVPTGEAELARSVMSGELAFEFFLDGGFTVPSGGLFSTINDLAKFGIGLLNSTLLPTDVTREWMKPITHTANPSYSVGAPWEIIRYIDPSTGEVTDIYTKLGDSGSYGGVTALVPEYGAGFSLLAAGTNTTLRSIIDHVILDHITKAILPALRAQAAAEATRKLVGTYVTTDPTLNSSVTISHNESTVEGSVSGLSISSWISNATDVLASPLFAGVKPRLLPSIPNQNGGAASQLAFQASTSAVVRSSAEEFGWFTGSYAANFDWQIAGSRTYGSLGVDLFVFDVDGEGRALAVNPVVTRARLVRRD